MRRRLTARRVVLVVLTPLLCYYLWLTLARATTLLRDDRLAFRGMGAGLVLLVLVATGLVVAEIRFGRQAEQVSRDYDASVAADDAPLPLAPSGRPDRDAADAAFERARVMLEERPDDWRGWYRLALAYGDARDTARGRRAMRRAIALHRQAQR
jgi:cytochrome c-type biogenesis protein CcmH/NrfG